MYLLTIAAGLGALENSGHDCWAACKQAGPCGYCGSGLCCRAGPRFAHASCGGVANLSSWRHQCAAEPPATHSGTFGRGLFYYLAVGTGVFASTGLLCVLASREGFERKLKERVSSLFGGTLRPPGNARNVGEEIAMAVATLINLLVNIIMLPVKAG